MRKLFAIFAVVLMVAGFGSAAWAAEVAQNSIAKEVANKINITEAAIAVQLVPMMKQYQCLDEKFKNEFTELNQEISKMMDMDSNFIKFLQEHSTDKELESINKTLSSDSGADFIDDLRFPKFNSEGKLHYPSLESNANTDIKSVSKLFSLFINLKPELVNSEQLKENVIKQSQLISSYLDADEQGKLKCKPIKTSN